MKNKQRNQLLKRRGALNRSFVNHKSIVISRKVFELLKRKRRVASYSPYRNEPNPNLLFSENFLYFPKVYSVEKARMRFFKGVLVKSFKGIKEPRFNRRAVYRKQLESVIVPGVGFDERGYRLGYGLGFYDRFLKDFKGLKVGVAFDCCVVKEIAHSEGDIPVDVLITERRKIFCKLRR
ncbi:5-formyltetrahydrofolate cyclo-ligase [Hippea alviniae]|uniref:5-formyltetrahydrofolate cyclo-ligase n=1 Tax=Hippea alviniae TaxID=1279027 RepID=UPI0003B44402|nr:5-formyltetrahydrofolate cyclo-ligase [Hippea alviniae]